MASKQFTAIFGATNSGQAAGYQFYDGLGVALGVRETAGVIEGPPGTYGKVITYDDGFQGTLRFDIPGPPQRWAIEDINPLTALETPLLVDTSAQEDVTVWSLKVGSTASVLHIQCLDGDGAPINFTGWTLTLTLYTDDSLTTKEVNNSPMTAEVIAEGKFQWSPSAGDVDTAGGYLLEIRATETATGKVLRLPEAADEFISVYIGS